jgi:hypothetical protein
MDAKLAVASHVRELFQHPIVRCDYYQRAGHSHPQLHGRCGRLRLIMCVTTPLTLRHLTLSFLVMIMTLITT